MLGADEKPDVTYADVGGLDMQKQEIREAVELPLTQFDLYKQIGRQRRPRTLPHQLICSRHRSSAWRAAVWSSWYRQDNACKSRGEQHNRQLHSSRWFRVRAEISGRGSTNGARRLPDGS